MRATVGGAQVGRLLDPDHVAVLAPGAPRGTLIGPHTAVDHVDLRIEPGETFGLLGPNGAGKTTTIRMLVTLLRPVSGRITVFGVNTTAQPMLVRRMIGYVPQLRSANGPRVSRSRLTCLS